MNPKVAILIINHNGVKILQDKFVECIKSALDLNYPCDVYVIDNSSNDESIEYLNRFYVKLIKLERNYGFSAGYNLGLMRIKEKYDYIVLMSNDYIIQNEDCIKEMLKVFENNNRIASLQCINLREDGTHISDVSGFFDVYFNSIARFRGFKVDEYPEKLSYVSFNVGAFVAFDLKKLMNISRFPFLFEPYYFIDFDDVELGLYIWSQGYFCAVAPIIGGIHLESKTIDRRSLFRRYTASRNKVLCYRKFWNFKELRFKLRFSFLKNVAFNLGNKYSIKGYYDGLKSKYFYRFSCEFYPLLINIKISNRFNILKCKAEGLLEKLFITDEEIKKSDKKFLVNFKL
jgi:Predicted glycosyltransferases